MTREPLNKKTTQAWRNFAATAEFRDGVEYLKRFHRPANDRTTVQSMLESAIGRTAYDKALEDLEDVLMEFDVPKNQTLDEPNLI